MMLARHSLLRRSPRAALYHFHPSVRPSIASSPRSFFTSSSNAPSSSSSAPERPTSIKKFLNEDCFAKSKPPRPFGFVTADEEGKLKNRPQKNSREIFVGTMTEFPTPQLNKFNGVPALTVDVLPTEAELESGAQHAVVWLVGAFARACAQIRETGRSEIAFSDEAFASRISPEIAACLDEQLQHYIQLGVVPVVEFSAVAASLQSTRWLPHDCDIETSSTSGDTDFHLGPMLLRELARGWLRTKISGTTLLYSLLGSLFPMRVSRAEAYFLISFDEHMQWASIQDKAILTAAQIAARGMAAPPPAPLGWRVGTAVWAPRTLFLSIVAPCTDPMRFRIRNLNEAVWAA